MIIQYIIIIQYIDALITCPLNLNLLHRNISQMHFIMRFQFIHLRVLSGEYAETWEHTEMRERASSIPELLDGREQSDVYWRKVVLDCGQPSVRRQHI